MRHAFAALFVLVLATQASAAVLISPNMSRTRWPVLAPEAAFHSGMPDSRSHHDSMLLRELAALRHEGLELRDADGGTLTDEHRDYLQTKLDRILAEARARR